MKVVDDISEMTIVIESGGSPSRQEVYTLLLRAMLELRQQEYQIKYLKDKLNA